MYNEKEFCLLAEEFKEKTGAEFLDIFKKRPVHMNRHDNGNLYIWCDVSKVSMITSAMLEDMMSMKHRIFLSPDSQEIVFHD